jgi:hypothetical protein
MNHAARMKALLLGLTPPVSPPQAPMRSRPASYVQAADRKWPELNR